MANGLGGVQPLGAHGNTVLDTVAAENTERVIQLGQAIFRRGVPAVGQEPVSLQQPGRADEFVRIPPE